MKKFISLLSVAIAFLSGNYAMAYDFSAVCSTGQTLYYNITSDTESYTVEVTYQIEGSYSNNYTYYETYPTGDLEIPESVEYNSITYSVTSIGENAFRGCSGLTSVNIPDIVTNIGYSAFMGCGSLTGSLIIPDLVTDIGNSAFSDCTGLTSLTLGNSVIYIGNSAFSGCSGLTSVTIPNSVNTIFSEAFYGCDGLISVNYNGDIEGWCNISFDEYGNPVSYAHNLYINNELLTNLIIPETITRIKAYLFTGDTCITSLTIHDSITSIGKYAFDSCSALTSITMGTGIESIGENAFRNTGWYNNQPDGVLYLDNGWCLGYKGNEPTGDLVLEEGTKGIVSYAFYNCRGITSVTIPSSVERIEDFAFSGLGEIILNFNATNCTLMGGDEDNPVFINTTITTLNIGENVRTIPDYAFYTCGGLTSVTIPNSVNRIGEEAFYFASELTDITLGTGIKHIGRRAFESTVWYDNQSEGILYLDDWCLGYKGDSPTGELTIAEGTLGIADAAFNNCEITSVTIPNSVTSIGGSAFAGCTSLASITIGTGVTHIGLYAFYNTEWYNSQAASILYLDNWCIGYKGEGNMTIENLVIQDGTIGIASYAFFDGGENTSIKSVTIPNSVFNIGEFAFAFCTGITDLTIGSNVNIEDEAFRFCENITSIQIFSNTPPTLGNDVFPETTYNTATVWVPIGSGGMYRNNSQWRQFANIRELPYFWSCDFEGDEIWTFGNDQPDGNVQWQIVTPDTYSEMLLSNYMIPFIYDGDTLCDTPEHWAVVDLISQHEQLGGPGQVAESPYIEFSGIDLSNAEHPQLRFRQIYMHLNTVETLIRVSTDGGNSWTDHIVNPDVQSNKYGIYFYTKDNIDIFEATGSQNVSIRFYMNSEGSAADEGYGWELDDIQIVEAPQCDLKLQEARISMFGYIDYRNIPDDFRPTITDPDERREAAYHYYDPYSQSPRKQWATESGYAAFNVEVSSYGYDTVTPMARIKITNPNDEEIYNKVSSGIRGLTINERDTVDFFNSFSFYFEGIESFEDIITGRYTVDFYVYADGIEDADTTDNYATQYFDITDKTFSMSYDEPTESFDYYSYYYCSSGDVFGTSFTYGYQPEEIIEVDVYIDSITTPGAMAQAIIYKYNDDGVPAEIIGSSDTLVITSDMLGSWVNFPLNGYVNSDTAFMVAIRGIWIDGQQTFAVGASDVLTSKGYKSCMRFQTQGDTWYYGAPQLAIRVREVMELNEYNIVVLSSNEAYGSVSGGGTYEEGATATLTATPNQGYRFVSWNDDNTENPRTITVTSDSTFVANFVQEFADTIILTDYNGNTYDINALLDDGKYVVFDFFFTTDRYSQEEVPDVATLYTQMGCNSGDVILMALEVTTHDAVHDIEWYMTEFGAIYPIVPLESNPTNETLFYNWGFDGTPTYICISPDRSMRELSRPLNYEELVALGAHERDCRAQQYTISILSNNDAYGSVSGGGTYDDGDIATIMAMPNGGYLFDSWEDDNAENPRTITVTSDSTFVADFVKCEITQAIDTVVPNFVTVGEHTFYSTGNYSFSVLSENDCDTIFDIRLRVLAEPVYDIGPNPTKSLLNINSDGFISAVEFYSTTGQLVMRKEVNGYEAEFDMEGLVDGVYILRIYGEESSLPAVSKVVKE